MEPLDNQNNNKGGDKETLLPGSLSLADESADCRLKDPPRILLLRADCGWPNMVQVLASVMCITGELFHLPELETSPLAMAGP